MEFLQEQGKSVSIRNKFDCVEGVNSLGTPRSAERPGSIIGRGACIMAILNTQRTTLIDTLTFSAQAWDFFWEIEQDQSNVTVPQVRFV